MFAQVFIGTTIIPSNPKRQLTLEQISRIYAFINVLYMYVIHVVVMEHVNYVAISHIMPLKY